MPLAVLSDNCIDRLRQTVYATLIIGNGSGECSIFCDNVNKLNATNI